MSIRKRKWTTASGVAKEAWVADYVDGQGTRRLKTFERKKEAEAFINGAKVEVREGTHVADSASVTVSAAGELWVKTAERAGLEQSTIDQYRQHLNIHISPFIGAAKLSALNIPTVREFEDKLRENGRSPAMVRKVLVSLGALIGDAQERGKVARNVVRDMRGTRKRGKERHQERRQKGKLKIGIDIPAPQEIKAIVGALEGRWRAILLTAVFCGLRASELRGLRWSDVDFDKKQIRVHQRADRYNQIGRPKSEAGERTVPAPPIVINTLRELKLSYARPVIGRSETGDVVREEARDSHLVFPNGNGKVESLANIINRGLIPSQVAAGVTQASSKSDPDGKETLVAKYTGMHALRHFYASWCINRTEDGGLGLPPKVVQERLGHSSIVITMDRYGHLFPSGDDADEMAAAERALLS